MEPLDLQQQDAQALAKGYSKWFRAVEIISIAAFWMLTLALAWKVRPALQGQLAWGLAAMLLGFVLADFVSGFVHWMADTWGSTEMPVLGKALIRPFREHHVDPKAMTHHDYIETNGANCLISLPTLVLALFFPVEASLPWAVAAASLGSMVFWVMMTNQIHKWSHCDRVPGWVAFLQKSHLILNPKHHDRHHTKPFDTYYCITTGWLNPLLHRLRFFRRAERWFTKLTGALPRRDDIGAAAAAALLQR